MRRSLLLLVGLVLAACGSTVVGGEDMALVDEPAVDADLEEVASSEAVAETITSAPMASSTTTTTSAPLPTGREALAAAQAAGEPVVLWFWGAH